MSVEARPAYEADLGELASLLEQAKTEVEPQRGGKIYLLTEVRQDSESFAFDLSDSAKYLVAGIFEDLLVGWGAAVQLQISGGPKVAQVKEIFVQKDLRELGVGEAILQEILDWAKREGCQAIEGTALPGNREVKGIFERFGIKTRMLTVYKEL